MENEIWSNIAGYIYENVIDIIGNRQIVMYGYSYRNNEIAGKLAEKGVSISFYVDGSLGKQKAKNVYAPSSLKNHSDEYFVIVPMTDHYEIIDLLRSFGYQLQDYYYLGSMKREIVRKDTSCMIDNYGNEIILESNDNKEMTIEQVASQIHFKGFNSTVIIKQNCNCGAKFDLYLRDNSYFEIGDNTKINCSIIMYDNCEFKCGKNSVFSKNGLIEMYDSQINIGNEFTIEPGYTFRTLRKSSILIGNDCMFSYNINMRTNDGHSIFDIHTGNNINSTNDINQNRNIKIGNHVWLGMNVTVLYNTNIADGSVIGAMSLVKSCIPNNCIAVGTPAHITRRDIAWSRNNSSLDINECGEEYIKYTEDGEI